jgi:ankyrin repeat protein
LVFSKEDESVAKSKWIVVAIIVLLVLFVLGNLIQVRVTKTVSLVGPDDPTLLAIFRDLPINEIERTYTKPDSQISDPVFLGQDLLSWSISEKRLDVAEWLLDKGAAPNSALRYATQLNDEAAVDLILRYDADPDAKPDRGFTARQIAKNQGYTKIVEKFLSIPEKSCEE